MKYLLHNSELYKEHNINVNTDWLSHFTTQQNNTTTSDKQSTSKHNSNKQNNHIDDLSDDDISDKDLPNAPSVNTLLTNKTIDPNNDVLSIAPAEGPENQYLQMLTLNIYVSPLFSVVNDTKLTNTTN